VAHLLEQGGAGGRQGDAALAAVEELDAELLLELATCSLTAGCATCRRSAALRKCRSSATATKYLRCRSSTAGSYEARREPVLT
jgi:hypothetical protein